MTTVSTPTPAAPAAGDFPLGTAARLAKLSFLLEEAAEISLFRPQGLRKWIAKGRLVPAYPGSVGRPHRFSPQQLVGLAVSAGMIKSPRGCSPEYAYRMVALFGAMSDEALAWWLGQRDAWTEEAFAVWRGHLPGVEEGTTPADERAFEELKERVRRVGDAILARFDPGADRTAGAM
jgi:hypothetical protein